MSTKALVLEKQNKKQKRENQSLNSDKSTYSSKMELKASQCFESGLNSDQKVTPINGIRTCQVSVRYEIVSD